MPLIVLAAGFVGGKTAMIGSGFIVLDAYELLDFDLSDLSGLEETLEMLEDVGALD